MKKQLLKRVTSGLTALCMVFSYTLAQPLSVFADDDIPDGGQSVSNGLLGNGDDSPDPNSGSGTSPEDPVIVSDFNGLRTAIGNASYIRLDQDIITASDNISPAVISVSDEIYIDLNGHSISPYATASGSDNILFYIWNRGNLTISDSSSDKNGKICGGTGAGQFKVTAVKIAYGGTFTLNDGSITDTYSINSGCAVNIEDGGTFILSGGSITGNHMYSNSTNELYAVHNEGTFVYSGGIVEGNTKDDSTPANVYLSSDSVIDINGDPGINDIVHITTEAAPVSGRPVLIARGTETDCSANFVSDNDSYETYWDEAGEKVMLRKKAGTPAWTWTASDETYNAIASLDGTDMAAAVTCVYTDNNAEYTASLTVDGIVYTDTRNCNLEWEWADDYSTASLNCNDGMTNIWTETAAVTVGQNNSFTAECVHDGRPFTDTVSPDTFTVTIGENTFSVPVASGKDYGIFTLTDDIFNSITVPAGTELIAVGNGTVTVNKGQSVNISANTSFTPEFISTWAKVSEALENGGTVQLYNSMTASDTDSFLYVPSGKSATLVLNNFTIDRGLTSPAAQGYAIRVDGSLAVSGGTVKGGYNIGNGGGLFINSGGSVTAQDLTISGNRSLQNGGGICVAEGGTIVISGDETRKTQITQNTAGGNGGGIYIGSGSEAAPGLRSTRGISLRSAAPDLSLSYFDITNNNAAKGGGMYVDKGTAKLGPDGKVLHNTDAEGHASNLDASETAENPYAIAEGAVQAVADGALGVVAGVPAASIATAPAWVGTLALAGGTTVTVITLMMDQGEGGSSGEDDDPRRCPHSWKSTPEWEPEHYSYVLDHQHCQLCGAYKSDKHTPETTVDESTEVTTYTVTLCDGSVDNKTVAPFEVVYQANFPVGMEVAEGIVPEKTEKIRHNKGYGTTYVLTGNKWDFDNEGLKFQGWYLNGENVTTVEFSGEQDNEQKIVEAHWNLPVKYEKNDSEQSPVISGVMEQNPSFVEPGAQHKVLENPWERTGYKSYTWLKSDSAKIERDGSKYKITYTYGKTRMLADATVTVNIPVSFKAEWIDDLHTITVDATEHGKIESDKLSAKEGDTVTITVTPDDGYKLKTGSLKAVYTKDGYEFPLELKHGTGSEKDSYKFVMVPFDVTVKGEFTYADEIGARLIGYSLSLEGDIGVNFYMELDQSVIDDNGAYMLFSLPGNKEQEVYVNTGEGRTVAHIDTTTFPDKTYYVFKCNVAAKEMTSEIRAQIHSGGKVSTEYKYTVFDYADYLLKHTSERQEYADNADIVKAMLRYGSAAQTYFEYNVEDKADKDLLSGDSVYPDLDIQQSDFSERTRLNEELEADGAPVRYDQMSLTLGSTLSMSMYFRINNGTTAEDALAYVNSNFNFGNYRAEINNAHFIVVRFRNITIDQLSTRITYTYKNTQYWEDPLNYIYAKYHNGDENLRSLVKALYIYHLTAIGQLPTKGN